LAGTYQTISKVVDFASTQVIFCLILLTLPLQTLFHRNSSAVINFIIVTNIHVINLCVQFFFLCVIGFELARLVAYFSLLALTKLDNFIAAFIYLGPYW